MQPNPTIHINEFCHYTTQQGESNGFQIIEREHPDFGTWKEKNLDLGHIRIFEHHANLMRGVDVLFDDGSVDQYVHHCISVDGEMAARFLNVNLSANLTPQSFHNLFLPGDEYYLGMGTQFLNVHIEVQREYYTDLLCDSEPGSALVKQKLLNNEVYYPGEFKLSGAMLQTIYAIFNSSLSGSLKKLLIEAKVHELIALQLHASIHAPQGVPAKNQRDLFHEIRRYLDESFLREHSLKSLSRHFGINEFLLKKGFRENFDTTVFDYILSKRMEHSQTLLQSTDQTIQQIAALVGYKYPNHFSAAFKKKFGMNPTDLRK